MDRRIPRSCAALLAGVLASCGGAERPGAPVGGEPELRRLEQLAPGVFVALQPHDERLNDGNVVVIVDEERVVIVDAPSDASFVGELIEDVRTLTDAPLRYVVNTHWHGDHTQGNALYREAFGAAVEFVGHASLLEDVPRRAAADLAERVARLEQRIPLAEEKLAEGRSSAGDALSEEQQRQQAEAIARAKAWLVANRDVAFIAPTLPYDEPELVLPGAGREIRLIHRRAHTRGDSVVFLPAEKVLVTGDLLDDLPYVGHGYPREWVDALRSLRQLDFDTVVPGHGPVFRGKQQLDAVLGFLEELARQAGAAAGQGIAPADAGELIDLSPWRETLAGGDEAAGRFFDAVLDEAIERAWTEARGGLADQD